MRGRCLFSFLHLTASPGHIVAGVLGSWWVIGYRASWHLQCMCADNKARMSSIWLHNRGTHMGLILQYVTLLQVETICQQYLHLVKTHQPAFKQLVINLDGVICTSVTHARNDVTVDETASCCALPVTNTTPYM
jgi:hypothetical protein